MACEKRATPTSSQIMTEREKNGGSAEELAGRSSKRIFKQVSWTCGGRKFNTVVPCGSESNSMYNGQPPSLVTSSRCTRYCHEVRQNRIRVSNARRITREENIIS